MGTLGMRLPGRRAQFPFVLNCGVRRYFNRDVECIRRFFRRRFRYESSIYPRFRTIKAEKSEDGSDEWHLDLVVCASGYDKGEQKVLEEVRGARPPPLASFRGGARRRGVVVPSLI